MIDELFLLLDRAYDEVDSDKKFSIFQEYSEKLKVFLSSDNTNVDKEKLKKLNEKHEKVILEVQRMFDVFKDSVKDFKKKNKVIKAYIDTLPKRISIMREKKG